MRKAKGPLPRRAYRPGGGMPLREYNNNGSNDRYGDPRLLQGSRTIILAPSGGEPGEKAGFSVFSK